MIERKGNKEMVSIIMPAYNCAKYIGDSIQSVLNQTYTDWELLIVEDCSTDNTVEVINGFLGDERIRLLQNKTNRGAAVSRNHAIREARGKWIAFLDGDDIWLPEKLEKQLDFMRKHGYRFTYTDYKICLNGHWQPYIYTGPKKVSQLKLYNYCFFFTSTVIYDREFVGLIQIEDLKKNNDYAMWFKIIRKTPCYRLPQCLSYYIKHDDSISGGSKFKLIKYHYIMYRKALYYGKFLSCIFTVNNLFWGVYKKFRYREKIEKYERKIRAV